MSKDQYSISFRQSAGKRKALRARISNIFARIEGRSGLIRVRDLSPTGLAVDASRGLKEGMDAKVSLYRGNAAVAQGLPVRVVRKEIAFTGLVFGRLSRVQQDRVHQLVLEEQKRLADLRCVERDKAE